MQGLDTTRLPADPVVRAQARAALEADGLERTYARLVELAPGLAASVERTNPRRVERALEIAILQGDASLPPRIGYPGPILALGLTVDSAAHAERIATRARAQFAAGLIEEARALRDRWNPSLPAFSAIGYREAWSVIDGDATIDAAIDADIERTIAFAKRQRTWFRSERSFQWLDATDDDPLPAALVATRAFLTPHD
jgi:tRNA dimethylallyltransferase